MREQDLVTYPTTSRIDTTFDNLKQKLMDFQLCLESILPQVWAIEALACFKHVEPSLLHDLLKMIPPDSDDIGKNARELVSLKFLEYLFTVGADADPISSASSKTVRLNPSDHCEVVLERLLNEISLSHPEPAELEISKWDLEPFIEHKRSNLPKYALKQLQDAILREKNSTSSSLKELSRLLVESHDEHQSTAKDGLCNGITSRAGSDTYDDLMDMPDESLSPVNKNRITNGTEELLNEKLDVPVQNCKDENSENTGKSFYGIISTNDGINEYDQNVQRTVSTVGEAEDAYISSDNDGHHDERTAIDAMKKTFISSQRTHSEDSLADLSEQHLCMKCCKGGNVLSCTSDSCHMAIHQSCLASDVGFDIREPFCCPFCAYSEAISKYMEVKKSTSLARNDLTTFICLGPQNESNKQPLLSLRIDGNCLKQNDGLPCELNQPNGVEKVSNHLSRKKLEFEQAGHSELLSDHSPPCGRKAIESTGRLDQCTKRDKQDGGVMRDQSPPLRCCQQEPIAEETVHNSQTGATFFHVSETNESEKHADVGIKREFPDAAEANLTREHNCSQSSQSVDAEEISKYESEDFGASKCLVKIQKQERQNLFPAIPQMKRKRIRWTSEEEDMLKNGMHLFCSPHDRIIHWKKILEFGEGIFHPSRSTMDLKDKWRNMCKATPKSK